MTRLVVLAKAPRAGVSKTRLCPPCTPQQAAALAEAALCDTLAAVQAAAVLAPDLDPLLVLDGPPGRWLPPGVAVVAQVPGGLDVRIEAALAAGGPGPVLLIGMDTPQVRPRELVHAASELDRSDAVLGLATDGGWWALGLARPMPGLVRGVPTSLVTTGALQLARLQSAGLAVALLPELTDVDVAADAVRVAALAPHGRFAAGVRRLHLAGAR